MTLLIVEIEREIAADVCSLYPGQDTAEVISHPEHIDLTGDKAAEICREFKRRLARLARTGTEPLVVALAVPVVLAFWLGAQAADFPGEVRMLYYDYLKPESQRYSEVPWPRL